MQANATSKRAASVRRLSASLAVLTLGVALSGLVASVPHSRTAAADPSQSERSIARLAPAASDVRQPTPFFGFLEFDWDASAPNRVPGFDAWPQDAPNPVQAQSIAANRSDRTIGLMNDSRIDARRRLSD